MLRFIERQNIAYLERLLASEAISDKSRRLVEEQLLAAQRRLATLTAVKAGLRSGPRMAGAFARVAPGITRRFRDEFEAATVPLILLDPGPGLRIVHANQVYTKATMIDIGRVGGEKLFNVFPDNPGDPFADGAANVFDSLRIVAETGQSHTMAVQRLAFILNRSIDMTARVPRQAGRPPRDAGGFAAIPGEATHPPSR